LGGRPISQPGGESQPGSERRSSSPVNDDYEAYALAHEWRLADLCDLIDALLSGGLLERTPGMRPTLVLTRAGHRALDALESVSPAH